MLVVVKVYITQEPGVSKFLTSAIKPLIATQMPSCVEYSGTESFFFLKSIDFSVNLKKTLGTLSAMCYLLLSIIYVYSENI